jgi:D-alanyl-D-alanine carboxypeptidase
VRIALTCALALAAVVVAAGAVRAVRSAGTAPARPGLQRILDGLVTGRDRIAPGAAAYVAGPHGTWSGSTGVADARTGEAMPPDARVRLESVSKAWTAALILKLVEERRLRLGDTVERWLPGLLPYGSRITLRQLLDHTSGMVDTNDITHDPTYLGRVRDPVLRHRIAAVAARLAKDPAYAFSPRLWIAFAGALRLEHPPGTTFHYSNIGYMVAGLVAERAGGAGLASLFRSRINEPLGLRSAAYDPQPRISGDHARGERIGADGALRDTTTWTVGLGANGGIVSGDGRRVAVLLLNGRTADDHGDAIAFEAMRELYCSA